MLDGAMYSIKKGIIWISKVPKLVMLPKVTVILKGSVYAVIYGSFVIVIAAPLIVRKLKDPYKDSILIFIYVIAVGLLHYAIEKG